MPAFNTANGYRYMHIVLIVYIETGVQHPYIYMKDLVELEAKAPSIELILSAVLNSVVTPLHTLAWRAALSEHPDKDFASDVCTGLSHGFRIGFDLLSANEISLRKHTIGVSPSWSHSDFPW